MNVLNSQILLPIVAKQFKHFDAFLCFCISGSPFFHLWAGPTCPGTVVPQAPIGTANVAPAPSTIRPVVLWRLLLSVRCRIPQRGKATIPPSTNTSHSCLLPSFLSGCVLYEKSRGPNFWLEPSSLLTSSVTPLRGLRPCWPNRSYFPLFY